MSRILVEYEQKNPTSSAFISAFDKFVKRYDIEINYKQTKYITKNDLKQCDILLSNRPFSPASVKIAIAAKKMGRLYFVHYDDDLYNLSKEYFVLKKRFECIKNCLLMADAVLASNPILAKIYATDTPTGRYVLINMPVDENEIVERLGSNGDPVKIVYAAGKDHAILFEQYIKPVVSQLFTEFGDKISLTFIGVHPDMSDFGEKVKIKYISIMPFAKYRKHMEKQNYDIGLAPLHDDPFSNKKYFNKFFEYSMAGVFGIYSDCLPYTLIVENRKNGLVVQNTPESWLKAIRTAVRDAELRDRCIKNAQNQLRTEFSTETITKKWGEELPEFFWYNASKSTVCTLGNMKIEYTLFSVRETLYKTMCYTRKMGFKYMLKKVLDHIHDNRRFGKNVIIKTRKGRLF